MCDLLTPLDCDGFPISGDNNDAICTCHLINHVQHRGKEKMFRLHPQPVRVVLDN